MAKQKMTPKEVALSRSSQLLGDVLTIVEAIVPPVEQDLLVTYSGGGGGGGNGTTTMTSSTGNIPSRQNTQREAVKDLVRAAFNRAQDDMRRWID